MLKNNIIMFIKILGVGEVTVNAKQYKQYLRHWEHKHHDISLPYESDY